MEGSLIIRFDEGHELHAHGHPSSLNIQIGGCISGDDTSHLIVSWEFRGYLSES